MFDDVVDPARFAVDRKFHRKRQFLGHDEIYKEALKYHKKKPAGKFEIKPTKAMATEYDLSLAYSPGVAQPCLEIQKNSETSFDYTNRGNLVGVISNGTAVLGLGNIGARGRSVYALEEKMRPRGTNRRRQLYK